MIKRLKKIYTDSRLENHWKKKLDDGTMIYGCTLKRSRPVKSAR
jgi:hypothetical protein